MLLYAQAPQNQTLEPILGTASSVVSLLSLALIGLTIILVGTFMWGVIEVLYESDATAKQRKIQRLMT